MFAWRSASLTCCTSLQCLPPATPAAGMPCVLQYRFQQCLDDPLYSAPACCLTVSAWHVMHSPDMPQSCCRFARKHHELQGCKAVICMPQEQYQVASMASLISWQANADAVSYGAAMVTLANRTDINTLQDVVGKTVSQVLPATDCQMMKQICFAQMNSNTGLMLHVLSWLFQLFSCCCSCFSHQEHAMPRASGHTGRQVCLSLSALFIKRTLVYS